MSGVNLLAEWVDVKCRPIPTFHMEAVSDVSDMFFIHSINLETTNLRYSMVSSKNHDMLFPHLLFDFFEWIDTISASMALWTGDGKHSHGSESMLKNAQLRGISHVYVWIPVCFVKTSMCSSLKFMLDVSNFWFLPLNSQCFFMNSHRFSQIHPVFVAL